MNRRNLLQALTAGFCVLLGLGQASAKPSTLPTIEADVVSLDRQHSLARIVCTPGVRIQGGTLELTPDQDKVKTVQAALAPLQAGYRRAATRAFTTADGRFATWRTFDLPLRSA